MDFRGTYTPLHAFREAYAKARAIGVDLSDSSSSDSEDEDLMPSPRTGLRRTLTIESVTEQRLEKMDSSQEVQSMTVEGSPRGTLSPRPPSSTGRRVSVARVTAFSPKTFVPVRQAASGRLSSGVGLQQSPNEIKQAISSRTDDATAGRAGSSETSAESAQAVPVQAHTRAARSSQGDMLRGSSVPAQEHRRNSTHTVKEDVDMQAADVQAQASRARQPSPVSTEKPLLDAPVPFRPAAVPFSQAAVPFKPVATPPQAAAQLFRPAAVPFSTSTTLPEPAQVPSYATAEPQSAQMGFNLAAEPSKSAAVPFKSPVRPTQSAAAVMPAKASSESAAVPSKAAQLSLDSAAVPAEVAKGPLKPARVPIEAAKVPFKPAPVPTEAAKVPLAAAPITDRSKQVTPVSSLRQPRQQSVILQTDQTVASSVSVTTVREDTGAAGIPAAEHAHGTTDPLLPATADTACAPKSGSAMMPSTTRIVAVAGVPDASPGQKAETPSKTPAQKADAPVAPPAAALTVSKADLTGKPRAGTPISPSPLKADLPVTPPAAKVVSQATLKADAIRAANQPNRPTQTILAQDESVLHVSADKAPQSSTVGACSESADRGSAEQPSQEGSQSADGQERFPRARRPIVSAVKANLVSLEPATSQVNSTKEPAHAEQRQSARGRPEDKLRLGQQTEAAQPAAAANAGKAQVPKLNLVQVMPVASVTPPARTKQPAAASRTLSPSPTPPAAAPTSSAVFIPPSPAVTPVSSTASVNSSEAVGISPVGAPSSSSVLTPLPRRVELGAAQARVAASSPEGMAESVAVTAPSPVVTAVSPAVAAVSPGLRAASPVVTPPPNHAQQGALQPRSKSAKKPPLHPRGSLTPPSKLKAAATPSKRVSPAGTSSAKAQEAGSSASARQAQHAASQAGVETASEATTPAAAEADEQAAAEPAAVLPGRVPLLCKGMTSEQYAALQHHRANKVPRKALAFQYPPGFPWSPQKEQLAFEADAAAAASQCDQAPAAPAAPTPSEAAPAAAQSSQQAEEPPEHHSQLKTPQAASLTHEDTNTREQVPQHQQQAGPLKAAAMGHSSAAVRAISAGPRASPAPAGRAVSEQGQMHAAQPETPPSAGRGSEAGVGAPDAELIGSHGQYVPVTSAGNAADSTAPETMGSGAKGKPSPLMMRPQKAQLAGSPSEQSPRAPWEIKASTVTTSPLAKKYAATPGIGNSSAAGKGGSHVPAAQDSLTAALSKKAQQRRAHKLAKHTPRGQNQSGCSQWLTAVVLMALCSGTLLTLAPHIMLPAPAAKWQSAVSGVAHQAASKLPPMVPTSTDPNPSHQPHPSDPLTWDTLTWEQHITHGPLHVWHQATLTLAWYLPESSFATRVSQHGAPAEVQTEGAKPARAGGAAWDYWWPSRPWSSMAEAALASPWQYCQRVAKMLPQLVATTDVEVTDEQGEPGWAGHAMAAPGDLWQKWTSSQQLPEQLPHVQQQFERLRHYLNRAPKAAGALVSKTGLWLLGGLESAMDLAGLSTEPAEQDLQTHSLSEPDVGDTEPAAEVEQPPAELAQIAAETAVPEPEPAVAHAVTAGGQSVLTEGVVQLGSTTEEAVADRPKPTEETAPVAAEHVVTDTAERHSATAEPAASDRAAAEADSAQPEAEVTLSEQPPQEDSPGLAVHEAPAVLSSFETLPTLHSEAATADVPQESAAAPQDAAAVSDLVVSQAQAVPEQTEPNSEPAESESDSHALESQLEFHDAEVEPPSHDAETQLETHAEAEPNSLGAELASETHSESEPEAYTAVSEPGSHAGEAEHGSATNPLSQVSQTKLQQLLTWASDRHRFSRPADPSPAPNHNRGHAPLPSTDQQQDQVLHHMPSQPEEVDPAAVEVTLSDRDSDSESAEAYKPDSDQYSQHESVSPSTQPEQHVDSHDMGSCTQHAGACPADQADSAEQPDVCDTVSDESAEPDRGQSMLQFLKTVTWTAAPAIILALAWLAWRRQSFSSGTRGISSGSLGTTAEDEAVQPAAVATEEEEHEISDGPAASLAGKVGAVASASLHTASQAVSRATSRMTSMLQPGSEAEQEVDSAHGGSGCGVDAAGPEGSGARTTGRKKGKLSREVAALAGNPIMRTPRSSSRRFPADSYNGRRGPIPIYHRIDTLPQSADTLDLRDGTILTPGAEELARAAENRELQSLRV